MISLLNDKQTDARFEPRTFYKTVYRDAKGGKSEPKRRYPNAILCIYNSFVLGVLFVDTERKYDRYVLRFYHEKYFFGN